MEWGRGYARGTIPPDRNPTADPPDPCAADTSARDVFLSYASTDAEVAEAVCKALEAGGVRCWIAPRDVIPGVNYADAIVRAIILILSAHAVGSTHVGKEVERASSKRCPILAVRIDQAKPTKLNLDG